MQMGMRAGLIPGLNARWVPSTADEFAAALPAVTAPDGLWIFDEATGDFADRIGSNDFAVAAGTVTRGVATPFGPGITLTTATTALAVASTTFMDGGTATDVSALIVARPPAHTATNRQLMGKRDGSGAFPGWAIYSNGNPTATARATIDGGTPSDVATVEADHGGRWSPYQLSWSWSAGLALRTGLGEDVDGTVAVSDITATTALAIGAGANNVEPGTVVAFAAAWDGYALTATERRILRDFFS
jgi:hypothetical protein